MPSWRPLRVPVALLAGLLAAGPGAPSAAAGKLADFEAGAVSGNGSGSGDACLADPLLTELAFRACTEGLFYGGASSWLRMNPEAPESVDMPDFTTRKWGEALIPVVRADSAYHWIESDVHAVEARVEAGYGPFAASYERMEFDEERPDDELTLTRWYGLFRMSFDAVLEVDLGFGSLTIDGDNQTDRFSFTLPVRFHPVPGCGIEFRPAWSDQVDEYDVALLGGYRFVSIKAGYRWLHAPGQSLDGPYAGLAVSF